MRLVSNNIRSLRILGAALGKANLVNHSNHFSFIKHNTRSFTMSPRRTAHTFVPKPLSWCLDGRETDLLHYVFSRPDLEDLRGSPFKVLRAIDDYSEQYQYLMNIGPTKGKYISDLIAQNKPSVMIELGGYVGYSAILFADAVRANGGKQYYSLEVNPEMAAISNVLVDLAGLRDFVRIMIGPSDESLGRLIKDEKKVSAAELVFIDHWQELYLPDLQLLEDLNVLKPGVSLLVADNMSLSGSLNYQEWLRATPEEKRALNKKSVGRSKLKRKQPDGDSGHHLGLGNPNLIYETSTKLFDHGSVQDGVEISKVIGEDNA